MECSFHKMYDITYISLIKTMYILNRSDYKVCVLLSSLSSLQLHHAVVLMRNKMKWPNKNPHYKKHLLSQASEPRSKTLLLTYKKWIYKGEKNTYTTIQKFWGQEDFFFIYIPFSARTSKYFIIYHLYTDLLACCCFFKESDLNYRKLWIVHAVSTVRIYLATRNHNINK